MGKTNLLDAIYYLSMTKSNFGNTNRQLVQHGADFFRLEGEYIRDGKKEKVVAKFQLPKTKQFERNGVSYKKLVEHIGLLPLVMIVPDDTLLVTGGSGERRKFIDNTLSQLDSQYLQQLLVYNKNLRQRNAALRQFGREGQFDQSLISAYDEQMAAPAAQIHERRTSFVEQFAVVFEQYYTTICLGQESARLQYRSQLEGQDYESLVREYLAKDRIMQRSGVGIHKDDLKFELGGYPLKRFASQGQLKSFVLALKLAQYEFIHQQKEESPILLLDDIFDKLDRQRVGQLIALLMEQNFGQVCITDTHESRLTEIVGQYNTHFQLYEVASGQVQMRQNNMDQ